MQINWATAKQASRSTTIAYPDKTKWNYPFLEGFSRSCRGRSFPIIPFMVPNALAISSQNFRTFVPAMALSRSANIKTDSNTLSE